VERLVVGTSPTSPRSTGHWPHSHFWKETRFLDPVHFDLVDILFVSALLPHHYNDKRRSDTNSRCPNPGAWCTFANFGLENWHLFQKGLVGGSPQREKIRPILLPHGIPKISRGMCGKCPWKWEGCFFIKPHIFYLLLSQLAPGQRRKLVYNSFELSSNPVNGKRLGFVKDFPWGKKLTKCISWLGEESGLSFYSMQGFLNENARRKEFAREESSLDKRLDNKHQVQGHELIQPINLRPLLGLYPWAVLISCLVFMIEWIWGICFPIAKTFKIAYKA